MHYHSTKNFLILFIISLGLSTCQVNYLAKTEFSTYRFDQNQVIKPDEAIEAFIQPYRIQLQNEFETCSLN